MSITCCNGCVPPKRTTTCHFDGTCDRYPAQKAKHEAQMEERNKKNETSYNLYQQTGERVARANKRKKTR